MPGFGRLRWLTLYLCCVVGAFGCSASDGPNEGGIPSGSLSLALTIADDFEIEEVRWRISGEGMEDMTGVISTGAPGSTASVEVFGIPESQGNLIEMEAASTDEQITCNGAANFDITEGQVTEVYVMLRCKKPQRLGGVRVNGEFNFCAELTKVVVAPLQTSVGNDIELYAAGVDEEDDPISYRWSSASGSIADTTSPRTTYTCTEAGDDLITITVSDDGEIYCVSDWTVPVTCVLGNGLCQGVICVGDGNDCTVSACNPDNGSCETSTLSDGASCNDGAGECMAGTCVAVELCADVTCPDLGECQTNTCNPNTGQCEASSVGDGTSCNGGAGTCMGGTCMDVNLCADVTCPDLGECQNNLCNPVTGQCEASDAPDGTSCSGGMCMSGSCEQAATGLTVTAGGPPAVFTGQQFDFTIEVTNSGTDTAVNVVITDTLPNSGSFVSSDPAGTPSGNTLTLDLGDLGPGASASVTVTWVAPDAEATLVNNVDASADNAPTANDQHTVAVGTQTIVTGGATAAGTGLRHRDNGEIVIRGVPNGAEVTRAVLVWALLYQSTVPSSDITFEGQLITPDLTQTISSNLCWGDSNTIGFAADVTGLVSGNGTYEITNPVNAIIREDDDPTPSFPLTDGASLIVFYGGPGFDAQVLSDFSYSAESANIGQNVRMLGGINSVGGQTTLIIAGPDGQNNFGERVEVIGSTPLLFDNTWNGSDPQAGPDFPIGNLWDTDTYDVSIIFPAGQTSLTINLGFGSDCTGLSAVVLQVEQ